SALVRQGLIPSSPISPSVVITVQALELYRVSRLRCPQFSVQAFVKTLSDLHEVQFRTYLSRQFSIAFDLYIAIRAEVDRRVQRALQRDTPDWRLRHACPACTYKLKDEEPLVYSLLYTMDGNDSLKRLLRRRDDGDADGVGPSSEAPDARDVPGDRYLLREHVDKWAHAVVQEMMAAESSDPDYNPCADRWKNMKDEITKRMWGIFDETGIFLALCRHGFSLVIADMVQSGELAKYPLAVVAKLLNVFGNDLGGGFDIGCKFKTTLNNSPLGPRARDLNHKCLVGAFHGHAHNRLCQLSHLATYVIGMGLEDLEGCERAFSKSNGLAAALRYASIFHRKQAINMYFEHTDKFDIYPNLTTFLLNNYKQALEILDTGPTALRDLMVELNIADPGVFSAWLAEERQYLQSLQKEPAVETLQMEYWQKLVNLQASEACVIAAGIATEGATLWAVAGEADNVRTTETARRHLLETRDRDLRVVQGLEISLSIDTRWQPGSDIWDATAKLVYQRKYQRALDHLEGLVISRIFELTKMNRSQTGKALQARSQAIRTALERYNAAARMLTPPRQLLEWKQVVEYAFLADFDLLRDARQDISLRPWAHPAARLALDLHFKICRAREEIQRLNVEIPRVATHIRDEDRYLQACAVKLQATDPRLAFQVAKHRMEQGRFTAYHLSRLQDIARIPGFTGSITPGIIRKKGDP
ncbi:hypothetical protein PLICRDRAFT_677552, partial [Plicaturopsis crispa FD-325 SS-3]